MAKNGNNSKIGGGGFHHVAIRARDFDKTLRFYMDGLGFRRAFGWGKDGRTNGERDSRAALLDTGDGNYLEVFAGGMRGAEEAVPEGAILHFALRTTDVDGAIERARSAGAEVTVEPKTVPVDGDTPAQFRIAFIKGLDGEIIEFFDNPDL